MFFLSSIVPTKNMLAVEFGQQYLPRKKVLPAVQLIELANHTSRVKWGIYLPLICLRFAGIQIS